ncbi:MAG: FAD-dependent oxidoreductase [Planctomycetota bacterium]|nr:FAD-dependent oxidoreductase [Planctomycetota bacterium]
MGKAVSDSSDLAWRCGVCGYIHRGPTPPESCPVCGAARSDFEAYHPPAAPPAPAAEGWRCTNCGYVHKAAGPPEECPVCGAVKGDFVPATAAATGEPVRAVGTVVVLGAGIAGLSAVEALRQASPKTRIVLLAREGHLPYYRLNLTRYLAGQFSRKELPLHPKTWYDENRVELLTGVEAVALSPQDRSVQTSDGRTIVYDKLILTAGAHPFVPPLPGASLAGVHSLRTVDDADAILAALRPDVRAVVIGGGILGIETAAALARRGAAVALLESHAWLMPRQLNRRAGELLAQYVVGAGVQLITEARTRELAGDGCVSGVLLDDGRTVPADLVVLATGVRSNSHLARKAGLEVNQGVVVDNRLGTSAADILAAGDVCEHHGVQYGNWAAAQFQGAIAGMNAAGLAVEFGGIPRSNTLKVLGVDLVSTGLFEPADGSYLLADREAEGTYFRFVLHDGLLVGAVMLGDAAPAGRIKKAIESRRDFSAVIPGGPTVQAVLDHLPE